eukprot:GHVS01012144.1.p1 GENE.GHVS01012144.1~~GHVS01012144.1.p1  ORF type:complete len:137 (-),score=10.66 GHVS01012144.1:149-559(-)
MLDDNKKIGVGLCAFGLLLGCVGVMLFFDRALLSLGNLAFLTGLGFLLGLNKLTKFFLKKDKLLGSFFYFCGFILIVYGHSLVGLLIEMYGVWRLFSAFLPNIIASAKLTPIGFIFNIPGIRQISQWIYDQRRLPL